MKEADVLPTLLDRLAAMGGDAACFSTQELALWPPSLLDLFKTSGLLTRSSPVNTTICPGCEQECVMPVEVVTTISGTVRAFVACDKREDTARVPVSLAQLEQWQCAPSQLADHLAKALALRRPTHDDKPTRLELGVLKGTQHSAHVVLHIEEALNLRIAGHIVPLADVLTWDSKGVTIERRTLVRCVDSPVAAAGDSESREQRVERLIKRRQELKNSGVRNFNQILAKEENLSVSAIKQLLTPKKGTNTWLGPLTPNSTTVQQKRKPKR